MREIPLSPITRRRLLQGSAAIAATSAAVSFLPTLPVYAAGNQPAVDYSGQNLPGATLNISTSTISGANILSHGYAGLSYEKASIYGKVFTGASGPVNTSLVRLFQTLSPNGGVLRLGGNSADATVWTPNGTGQTANQVATVDVDALYEFLQAVGNWQLIYAVNLGGFGPSANSASATTLALAAAEVYYVYNKMGSYLLGIEIGNEPDVYNSSGNGWGPLTVSSYTINNNVATFQTANKLVVGQKLTLSNFGDASLQGLSVTVLANGLSQTQFSADVTHGAVSGGGSGIAAPLWNVTELESIWTQFYDAIVSGVGGQNATPDAPITGPSSAGNTTTWTVPFGEAVTKNKISLLTEHYYDIPYCYPNSPPNGCLYSFPDQIPSGSTGSPAQLLADENWLLKNLWPGMDSRFTGTLTPLSEAITSIGVPYRLTECGCYDGGGMTGVANGYLSALWALDFLFTCVLNGCSGCNFHGGGYNAYAPITDNGAGELLSVQPVFYGMMLFNQLGVGSMVSTLWTVPLPQSNGQTINVNAYALQKTTGDGGVYIVINNKDPHNSIKMTLQLSKPVSTATLTLLTQGALPPSPMVPDLFATNGVNSGSGADVSIQGAVLSTGTPYTAGTPYNLTINGYQVYCVAPLLGAVLIYIQYT